MHGIRISFARDKDSQIKNHPEIEVYHTIGGLVWVFYLFLLKTMKLIKYRNFLGGGERDLKIFRGGIFFYLNKNNIYKSTSAAPWLLDSG